jgi:hypothetical protein
LFNNDRRNKEEDIADLPWLTDRDVVQIQQEFLFLRQRAERSKHLWFRTDVLIRYKNHGYCEVDATNPFSCVLIFLDYDKKHIATSALFEIHNGNIIMIRAQDFLWWNTKGKKSLAKVSDKQ